MGIKQTIRRLASVRGSSISRRGRRDSDLDAVAPITGSLPERISIVVEEESTESAPSTEASLRKDQGEHLSYKLVLGADMISHPQPQKPTGKRKPSNAARLRQLKQQEQRHQADGNPRPRRRTKLNGDEEPPPQDYLYFGEAGGQPSPSPSPSSSSSHADTPMIQITPAASSPGATGRAISPFRSRPLTTTTTTTTSSPGLTVPGSGTTDASGFYSAGVVTQDMGYQNLTYGGSLQFDYAQVQAPGAGAGYGQ